jgi:NTP pyrophosphatase (non-canonical NTP hydrolase)
MSETAVPLLSLNDYISWSAFRWMPARLHVDALVLPDLMVMALGLGGECSEVAEAIEDWDITGVFPAEYLRKELGDVLYYWASLCWVFKVVLNPPAVASATGHPTGSVPLMATLRLVSTTGTVSELLKKYVRDGVLPLEQLQTALAEVFRAWVCLCESSGLSWSAVMAENRLKIEGRVLRGTLRGSGNHR